MKCELSKCFNNSASKLTAMCATNANLECEPRFYVPHTKCIILSPTVDPLFANALRKAPSIHQIYIHIYTYIYLRQSCLWLFPEHAQSSRPLRAWHSKWVTCFVHWLHQSNTTLFVSSNSVAVSASLLLHQWAAAAVQSMLAQLWLTK